MKKIGYKKILFEMVTDKINKEKLKELRERKKKESKAANQAQKNPGQGQKTKIKRDKKKSRWLPDNLG